MKLFALTLDSSVNQQVWEFLLSGGTFMFFIVACSLVSAAIVIHRAMSLRREGVMPRRLVEMLENVETGRVDVLSVRDLSIRRESPLGDVVVAALGEGGGSGEGSEIDEASRAAEAVAREEILRLQTGLSVLEDVITIAPLLGLLGTVSGLVGVFAELGSSGGNEADPAVLAGGIARALNTTIAGLAVAVPTVVARSYFTKKIETMAARMEVLVGRLIYAVHRSVSVASEGTFIVPAAESPTAQARQPSSVPAISVAPLDAPSSATPPSPPVALPPLMPLPRSDNEGGSAL